MMISLRKLCQQMLCVAREEGVQLDLGEELHHGPPDPTWIEGFRVSLSMSVLTDEQRATLKTCKDRQLFCVRNGVCLLLDGVSLPQIIMEDGTIQEFANWFLVKEVRTIL